MNINKAGIWGEVFAARYLRDNGYFLIAGNYRCRMGEIDIIAGKDGVVCFVEVKTRAEDTLTRPMEAVDEGKQERIRLAAQSFLLYSKLENEIRFDVCEVYLDGENKAVKITLRFPCGDTEILNAVTLFRRGFTVI